MLCSLFDEGGSGPSASTTPQRVTFEDEGRSSSAAPPPGRGPSGLVGLENQGATCYLNSLIQVFVATPELRRAVLEISDDQIALTAVPDPEDAADGDADIAAGNPQLRRIPYELQRLLARLLMCDRESLSTRPLTRSFGWDRREHADQHDVQELLRLLFSALEDSLAQSAGSPYAKIARQVTGAFCSSIKCRECGHASSRTEAFLDLCVTTVGFGQLENSLDSLFGRETLAGDNQYRCDRCQKLVDAEKTSQLTLLPPILTLSLMRFDFDFARMARIKHDGRFEFPAELDLGRYLADDYRGEAANSLYDLCAVVIHSGSAMGGHYHAYVLDVEGRGAWSAGDTASASQSQSWLSLAAKSPELVLAQVLRKAPDQRVRMSELGSKFVNLTSRSWNNTCKDHWGGIEPFVRSRADLFQLVDKDQWVQLKDEAEEQMDVDKAASDVDMPVDVAPEKEGCASAPKEPHWFDLNDSRVIPITAGDIKRQFSGRESAYMLFYRQRNLTCNLGVNYQQEMPEWLFRMVHRENQELRRRRGQYDEALHRVSYNLFHESQFKLRQGSNLIWDLLGEGKPQAIAVGSCKKSVDKLLETIKEKMTSLMHEIGSIVCLERTTDCGYYAVCRLPDAEAMPSTSFISSAPFMPKARDNNPFVFVCFSTKLQSGEFLCGVQHRPVKLTFHFGEQSYEAAFPASQSLINCIKSAVGRVPEALEAAISAGSCHIQRESDNGGATVPSVDFEKSVGQLSFRSGDRFVVSVSKEGRDVACQLVEVTMIFNSDTKSTKKIRIKPGHQAGQVKQLMLDKVEKQATSTERHSNWRVEVYNEQLECFCPEPDSAVIGDLRAPRLRLTREPPPGPDHAFVKVTRENPHGAIGLLVKLTDNVSQLRETAAKQLDIDPSQYHLCYISLTGDPLKELREGRSLTMAGVKHGSELCLAYGRPLLVGQIRLRLYERLPFDASNWLVRLSQSPDSLVESRGYLVVDTAAKIGDLPGLLAKEKLLSANGSSDGETTSVALFRRKGRHQLTALLRPWETLDSAHLSQKEAALCFDQHCGKPPVAAKDADPPPVLLFVTTRVTAAADADYAAPTPLWWPVGDDADDSAASLYAAVSRSAVNGPDAAAATAALRLAKRQHDRCEWLPIPITKKLLYSQTSSGSDTPTPLTGLIKTKPYLLRDGDVIAWTTGELAVGGGDQFQCPQDENVLSQRRQAKEFRGGATFGDFDDVGGGGNGGGRVWPAEKPLSISVPNYGPIN